MKKLLTITVPASVGALAASAALIEATARLTWDPSRGRPGLFLSHPVRTERLAENYDGWFAGVPVRTNALGFRDTREYRLDKGPQTFRILVLGDSVTFGHGSVYEHTYPYLLEQRLKAWRRGVDWEVWNLGVPGYNTSHELAYLLEVGPVYRPDLVVVGFFGNDVVENRPLETPTRQAVVASRAKTWLKRHAYSFDWYRRAYLTLQYRLFASSIRRNLLENLAAQDRLLSKPSEVAGLEEQRLKPLMPLTSAEFEAEQCTDQQVKFFSMLGLVEGTPGLGAWKAVVRRFHELHRTGAYRIAFFINAAPDVCNNEDVFDPRATKPVDDFYLTALSDGTPAVSSHDAFLWYRPSHMPQAGGHSLGNANVVKAEVLFELLRDRVLPPMLDARRTGE